LITSSARRFALALALGASFLTASRPALAQNSAAPGGGVTGTDPVPKGCGCSNGAMAPTGTASTSTTAPAATTTTTDAMIQAALLMLGLR
jgi:hypothetical protein